MKTTITETNDTSASKASPPPPFYGATLEQVLQFVLPEDVARVSMVCKTWRDELLTKPLASSKEPVPSGVLINSTPVWKQAVTNINPNVVQAIIEATKNSDDAEIDFLALAKSGLGRKRKKPELPEPSLLIEDLMIVVELKQKQVIIDENGEEKVSVKKLGALYQNGSWAWLQKNHCGNFDFNLKGQKIIVEGQNPLCPDTYNGSVLSWQKAKTDFQTQLTEEVIRRGRVQRWHNVQLPFETAGYKALSKLIASVTLVRRDDWRSFLLVDDLNIDGVVEYSNWRFDLHDWDHWGSGGSPFARSELGSVAHEVIESNEITAMVTSLDITFGCVLPPPDTSKEPSWLQKCRGTRLASWTDQDYEEISQVKTFQFRLEALSLGMGMSLFGDDMNWGSGFADPKQFLLLLEGLDWK